MNLDRPRIIWICLALSLTLSTVGCGLGLPGTAGPVAPCSVAASQQAVGRLLQKIKTQNTAKGKTVTITLTSEEITSALVQAIQAAKQNDANAFIPVENPVVCFNTGKMSLFGRINALGDNKVNALIAIRAAVNAGKAAFEVDQIQVGSFSVPTELGDQISKLINDALNQNISQLSLVTITIGNGQMTLTGNVQ